MNLYNYLASIFTISEVLLLVLKRSKTASVKSRNDRQSLLLLWIGISFSLGLGYFIAVRGIWLSGDPSIVQPVGIGLFIAGLIIRWASIVQLGNMFTVDVSISSGHVLKTSGLYRIVRHPSYLGLMLIICGLSLLMNNLLSIAIIITLSFAALNYRIKVEEKVLTDEFGDEYRQYKKAVKRIIPFVY